MQQDRSFIELNRTSTNRIRLLANKLSDEELQYRVGQHWTVAVALVHLAFWDRRVLNVLDVTEQSGELYTPEVDIVVNDISLPFWAAISPRQAVTLCIETAEALDARPENLSPELLDKVYAYNKRWVIRALHRNEHLDEVDTALKG